MYTGIKSAVYQYPNKPEDIINRRQESPKTTIKSGSLAPSISSKFLRIISVDS